MSAPRAATRRGRAFRCRARVDTFFSTTPPFVQVNGTKSGSYPTPKGVEILGAYKPEFESILTGDALAFVADLARKYSGR